MTPACVPSTVQFGQFASCTLKVLGAPNVTDVEELGTTEDDDKDCRVCGDR